MKLEPLQRRLEALEAKYKPDEGLIVQEFISRFTDAELDQYEDIIKRIDGDPNKLTLDERSFLEGLITKYGY